ncbi:hypothetical protein HJFPF1_09741 [Paramyrothecium foliicola]|nr:hypothetical protein HJFPF1_09741 [Paramyrothecium foliicola]
MIASIALEQYGVPLKSIAPISVARYANNVPSTAVSWIFQTTLRRPLRIMAAFLAFTTLASQFTSTLLVTDLDLAFLVSFDEIVPNAYKFISNNREPVVQHKISNWQFLGDPWRSRLTASETFAEYSELVSSSDAGVDDTGPTVRAFLPLASQEFRQTIRYFQGMAPVQDARVSCIRPDFAEIHFCEGDEGLLYPGDLCGLVTVKRLPNFFWTGLVIDQDDAPQISFRCPLISSSAKTHRGHLNIDTGFILCEADSFPQKLQTSWDTTGFNRLEGNLTVKPYIVFNNIDLARQIERSQDQEDPAAYLGETDLTTHGTPWEITNTTGSGPWLEQWSRTKPFTHLTKNLTTPGADIRVKLSLCFDNFGWQGISYMNITAFTTRPSSEPNLSWNKDESSFEIDGLLDQLGAGQPVRRDAALRGILSISPESVAQAQAEIPSRDPNNESELNPFHDEGLFLEYRLRVPRTGGIVFCSSCEVLISRDNMADILLSDVFDKALQRTGSLAIAVQTVKTADTAIASATTEQWQGYVKDWLEPDSDETDKAVLAILQDLLLAPESDKRFPVQIAAQKLLNLYHENYLSGDSGYDISEDKGASAYLDCISRPVVDLARYFGWDGASHQRLADTVVAVRDGCADSFNEENPKLVYNAEGLLEKVDGAWNAYSISRSSGMSSCRQAVNVTALFAKLFGAGLFNGELKYVLFDLEEGLMKGTDQEGEQPLGQRAIEARAAAWLFFGGEIIAQVAWENDAGSSKKQFPDIFNRENWKSWVNKLAMIARDAPDEAEFGLRRLAANAYSRMLELYPEVWEQDG